MKTCELAPGGLGQAQNLDLRKTAGDRRAGQGKERPRRRASRRAWGWAMVVPQGTAHPPAGTAPSMCDGATAAATMGSSVSGISWAWSARSRPSSLAGSLILKKDGR